ncbi:DUF6207 family protein [Streptomyces violaceoruber]|uniref:DUF6207 family protein n=1 Tax=Streptomyces TaxID=1883 RepID=UPI0029B60D5F|nr:DUF6207 family protein [Streptomyces sp. ME02-6977A]MDX3406431.1 DUF6207 family protein [Streptomyces sp. ME02-6977A]
MRSISEAHVARPGLAVVEVAALDDATAFAVQELLAAQCAIAAAERTVHEPGEPGVRLRLFLDLHPDNDPDNVVSNGEPAGTGPAHPVEGLHRDDVDPARANAHHRRGQP